MHIFFWYNAQKNMWKQLLEVPITTIIITNLNKKRREKQWQPM